MKEELKLKKEEALAKQSVIEDLEKDIEITLQSQIQENEKLEFRF